MLTKRIILLLASIVIGYFFIYFGDGIYTLIGSATVKNDRQSFITLSVFGGLILTVLGGIGYGAAMKYFLLGRGTENTAAIGAAAGLVCFGCVFGILAGPFTNYGVYPWYWTSRWDFLPILALVPTVFVIHDIISKIVAAKRRDT